MPLRCVKLWPATIKSLVLALTVPKPAASTMSMMITVSVSVSIPKSIPKRVPNYPSDYTDDDYNWGTNQYSSPLSAPSSPTPYGSDNDVNVIRVDSKVEDVKPAESADGKLGT